MIVRPAIVTVPTRFAVAALIVSGTVTVPFLVPLPIVTQAAWLLADHPQPAGAVTVTVLVPPVELMIRLEGDTDGLQAAFAACVTV